MKADLLKTKDPTAAVRQARRREKLKKEQGSLRNRDAWSAPAPSLPTHKTIQHDGGDPGRWSAVPTLAPPAPEPGAPPLPPGAPPGPEAVVVPGAKEPTEEERAGAAKAAGLVLLVWGLGAAAATELATSLKADPSANAMLKMAAEQAAQHWADPALATIIQGAAERCAIRYGVNLIGAPPDEVVVGAALVTPIAVLAVNYARKRKELTATRTTETASAAPPVKKQDWDIFGDIPTTGASV